MLIHFCSPDPGVTIGAVVAVVIIVLLGLICITMIIFGTCLYLKRGKRPSIQEHETVAALEDLVPGRGLPCIYDIAIHPSRKLIISSEEIDY